MLPLLVWYVRAGQEDDARGRAPVRCAPRPAEEAEPIRGEILSPERMASEAQELAGGPGACPPRAETPARGMRR